MFRHYGQQRRNHAGCATNKVPLGSGPLSLARLVPPVTVLLGALLSIASAGEGRPEDERICGGSPDGKIKWCVNLRAPKICGGPEEGWHCDEAGLCWCGPENALTWPGDDGSGWPLVAREAMTAGERCKVGSHEGRTIGGCTVAGWVCTPDWCQDSAGRAWEPLRR